MDDIRERLIDAAVAVFAEKGYAGAGVAQIARHAGLTTGAIYSRYSGKAELMIDALDVHMAEHLEAILSNASGSATDVLSQLGSHLLEPGHESADGLFIEAVVAARREPELAAMLERRMADERSRVAKLIGEAKADGVFDPALDTSTVVTFIQSIGLGFSILRTLQFPMPDADEWHTVIDRVVAAALPIPSTPTTHPMKPGEDQ